MSLIRPIAAYVTKPEHVHSVVAPPLGSISPDEWDQYATTNPLSYLQVMRSAIDASGDRDQLLAAGAAKLQELMEADVFTYHPSPVYLVYRLSSPNHTKLGLIADVAVAGYDDGRVLRHEDTLKDVEQHIADHHAAVGASSNPVALAHSNDRRIADLLRRFSDRKPADVTAASPDGLTQSVWVIDDPAEVAVIDEAYEEHQRLYITDGHHRTAAASRLAAAARAADPGLQEDSDSQYVLAALFAEDQVDVRAYNRCVSDLGDLTPDQLVTRIAERFEIEEIDEPEIPHRKGQIGMTVQGRWYRIRVPEALRGENPYDSLDVTILQQHILAPLLGVTDPSTDHRLHFIGSHLGPHALGRSDCAVGFALYPTSIAEVMAVADAHEIMPPKSTWFEPKPRAGLVVRPIES